MCDEKKSGNLLKCVKKMEIINNNLGMTIDAPTHTYINIYSENCNENYN